MLAYPTVDRSALAALAELTDADPDGAPVVMVDCREHLDLIEQAVGTGRTTPIRVAIEIDVSYWLAGGRVKIGAKRSPVRTPRPLRRWRARSNGATARAAGRA